MTKNMGSVDRVVRLILGVVLAALVAVGTVTGALAVVLGIIAIVMFVTGLLGVCPLYKLLGGFSTRKE